MPTDRTLYPEDWDQIAAQVKADAHYICQICGRQCYPPGEPCADRAHVMSVHHRDHDPSNSDAGNLMALCAPCHLRLDAPHHARNARRTRARKTGQMWLPEMEYVT